MRKIIVSDASCLILFHKIGELDILRKLFGNIYITETVSGEFKKPTPDWINIEEPPANSFTELLKVLDPGEASSIALAACYENSLLIIDDLKGRKIAKETGLDVTGSLGVIIAAKEKGYITSVRPVLKKILKTNFRISNALLEKVLKYSGED
jgi:predicted nucleic acid-binding protein